MSTAFVERGLVFGHRGVPWETPANTLAGFRRACELGLDGVELDVQRCRSGELVVIHDFSVNTTTNGEGRVDSFVFEALRELDAGGHFHPSFAHECIPTLDEVLEETEPDLLLNVEIKSNTFGTNGVEDVTAGVIRRHAAQRRVLVSSFNPFALFRFRRALPDVPIGLLYTPDSALYLRRAWFASLLKPNAMHPNFEFLTTEGLRFAKDRADIVNTWTVNDVSEMRRLLDAGIHAIMTDEPAVLQAVVAREPPPPPMELAYKAAREAAA